MKRLQSFREEIEDLRDEIIEFAEDIIRDSDVINLKDFIREDEEPSGYDRKTDTIQWSSYYYFDFDECNASAYDKILEDGFITDEDIQEFNKTYDVNITKEEFLQVLKDNDGYFEPFNENSYKWED